MKSLSDKHTEKKRRKQAEDGLKAIDKKKLDEKVQVWCLQYAL